MLYAGFTDMTDELNHAIPNVLTVTLTLEILDGIIQVDVGPHFTVAGCIRALTKVHT